jgi:hypothetical protein
VLRVGFTLAGWVGDSNGNGDTCMGCTDLRGNNVKMPWETNYDIISGLVEGSRVSTVLKVIDAQSCYCFFHRRKDWDLDN